MILSNDILSESVCVCMCAHICLTSFVCMHVHVSACMPSLVQPCACTGMHVSDVCV